MLRHMLIASAVSMVLAASVFAEDATPPTSIQVYGVADLVSYNTLHQAEFIGHISPAEWRAEHAETIASLDRLVLLVKAQCATKLATVEPHRETLSLVVRNTAEGHREVDQLLQSLRTGNKPSIWLTCQSIGYLGDAHVQALPSEEQERAFKLVMKQVLSPDETREARELLGERPDALMECGPVVLTVPLVAGRKTSWGISGFKTFLGFKTATACLAPDKSSIQLRVDYVNDDLGDTVPVGTQTFEIPIGSSAVFIQHCDGAYMPWLITPTMIDPATVANAQTHR